VDLRLRPYRASDEASAVAIHRAMESENFHFLLGWDDNTTWSRFLRANEEQRRGDHLAPTQVRGVQLAAVVGGELVGRASLRFELNDFYATLGGHVGYGVAPLHRRRGYASEILRQALVILRGEGVEEILLTCRDDNVGSATVIERHGGAFESLVPDPDGPLYRRYWIR